MPPRLISDKLTASPWRVHYLIDPSRETKECSLRRSRWKLTMTRAQEWKPAEGAPVVRLLLYGKAAVIMGRAGKSPRPEFSLGIINFARCKRNQCWVVHLGVGFETINRALITHFTWEEVWCVNDFLREKIWRNYF